MIRRWPLPILLLSACGPSGPGGPPPGDASQIVWRASDGKHQVTEDLTIGAGVTLTIEPGVTVEIAADASLIVEGELIARGTMALPITFTSPGADPSQRWGSVVFADASRDAEFEDLHRYVRGSIVEWCVFENAKKALHLDAAAPYVHQSTFRHCKTAPTFSAFGGPAIYMENGSTPRIRECTFSDNEASPTSYGGAIFVRGSDPIMQDNRFLRNQSIYGGAVSTDLMAAPIVGSRFEENTAGTEGGGISLVSSVATLIGNTFVRNHAGGDGGGVHVCVTCFPHATPILLNNTIMDNTSDAVTPGEGAAGIGAAHLRAFSYNNMRGNLRAGMPSDFGWFHRLDEGFPTWVSDPDVTKNYWGATDDSAISTTIFDGADDPALGKVDWKPALGAAGAAPGPLVALSSRKLRYVDNEAMIPLFLTVYNPGPSRAVVLRLSAQFENGAPEPFGAELGFFRQAEPGVYTATMPENAVYFLPITGPTDPHHTGARGGTYRATLSDASTKAALGDEAAARFELGMGQGG